jgi:hypothetical protein
MINENLAIILVILARLAIDISVQGQGLGRAFRERPSLIDFSGEFDRSSSNRYLPRNYRNSLDALDTTKILYHNVFHTILLLCCL